MSRPPFEVADVIRIVGDRFRQRHLKALAWPQVKVLNAITHCRTAALGGTGNDATTVATKRWSTTRAGTATARSARPNAREHLGRETATGTATDRDTSIWSSACPIS